MSLRPCTRPKTKPRVSIPAHDAALHFLARPKQYSLTDAERADLVQVVEGYTSPHDHDAARRGIEWMREHYRRQIRGVMGLCARPRAEQSPRDGQGPLGYARIAASLRDRLDQAILRPA
jgi:hypothetical protein